MNRTLAVLAAALLAGCASDEPWRAEVKELITQGRYDQAIELAGQHVQSPDEPERQSALSLVFGAKLAQLKRVVELKAIEEAITGQRMLGQVADRRILPETLDRPRRAIVRPTGFEAPIETAGPDLAAKLRKRVPLLALEGAEVSTIFARLFEETGVNLLVDPAVVSGKRITLSVKDATVSEILEHVAEVHQFRYAFRENSVLVHGADSPTLLTRTYRLAQGLAEFDQSTSFNSLNDLGLIVSVTQGSIGGGRGEGGGQIFGEGAARSAATRALDVPGDELGSRSFLDQLLAKLPRLVDWPEGSEAYLDRQNNLLIVRATPRALEQLDEILGSFDAQAPQILIEARYLEIASSLDLDLGVEWLVDRRFEGPVLDPNLRTDVNASGPTKGDDEVATRSGSFFGLPAFVGGGTTGSNLRVVGIFDDTVIDALVYTLSRDEATNTLAAPHILAANNSRAQIGIVRNLTFIESFDIVPGQVSQTQESVVSTPTTVRAVVNDSNYTGILLNVKPSVGADGRSVHIVLQPVIRDQVDEIVIDNGAIIVDAGQEVSTPQLTRPIIETRLINTQLTIEDGATIVIGGLVTARDAQTTQKVPFLGDLPGIGAAFRRDTTSNQKRNLLILLTARILNPAGGEYTDEEGSE